MLPLPVSSPSILLTVAAMTVIHHLTVPIQAVCLETSGGSLHHIQHAVLQHILSDLLVGIAGIHSTQRMTDRAVHEGVHPVIEEGDARSEQTVLTEIHSRGLVEDVDGLFALVHVRDYRNRKSRSSDKLRVYSDSVA